MKDLMNFSEPTKQVLRYYVYALVDPRDSKIFYIGKGIGDRAFAHAREAAENDSQTDKLDKIRSILDSGLNVNIYILRHGMTEPESFLVESVIIDLFNYKELDVKPNLTNIVAGHYQSAFGIKTAEEIESIYSREPLDSNNVEHELITININRAIEKGDSYYNATRKSWKLSQRRANKARYILSEHRGVIVAIFETNSNGWVSSPDNIGRYEFEGNSVEDSYIIDLYMNKRITKGKGQANPIRYFSPKKK